MLDPRVTAVRADTVVGQGSQAGLGSVVYNCFTDEELIDWLDEAEVTTPAGAVKEMREFESIKADQQFEIENA